MPKVSVVIPTYNRSELIRRTMRSVENQTFEDWELIVVDDGSEDETEKIVKSKKSSKINYVSHKRNRGASAARNTGIEASSGEYVAFLDADDEWIPTKLELQVGKMDDTNVEIVYCSERVKGRGKNKVRRAKSYIKNARKKLMKKDYIGSCSKVMARRRSLREAGLFDESLSSQQDWDMWFRLSKFGDVAGVENVLVVKHLHEKNISNSLEKEVSGKVKVYEKQKKHFKEKKDVLAYRSKKLSIYTLAYSFEKGYELAITSLREKKIQPKLLLALLVSFANRKTYKKIFLIWRAVRGHTYDEVENNVLAKMLKEI